ncbi:MAG: cytochrome b N-terminal domain-containing protein [Chloroflexi bacterium]|nr:cytochrome b N-terminal domain-containing protein [Chloroflexota bacterium]
MKPSSKQAVRRSIATSLVGLFFLMFAILSAIEPTKSVRARAPEPTSPPPEATPWQSSPRLKKPFLPANPTMAEQGAIPYWSICLSCHGDKGQGLTDEWREAGFGEDMNCWKSKCHAVNHPTPGFNFPRQVPPIIGSQTLQRFTTVDEVQKYIKTTMPWWDPGTLSEQDSWNLTAYLLRENGNLPAPAELNPNFAALSPVHLPIRERKTEFTWQYGLASLLGLATISLIGKRIISQQMVSSSIAGKSRPNFFHHLHPPTIPLPQARWRYTLGAGGLAIFLSIIIAITGVLEMFFYIPTPGQAGQSIQLISFLVPYGGLIRGLHFWAAQSLVVVSAIHLLRVIFTGAYHTPRRFNFLLGLALFILVIFLNFTGYILRWDNGIHWALIVGTNLLKTIPFYGNQIYRFLVGGETPGLATLTRFYAWHIFGLTIATIILLGWHIFRVRRDGGISAPDPENRIDSRRINRFELVSREILAMLIASLGLILLASLIPAPIAAPIQDASMPLNPDVRAPWFFLWVQQLLRFGNAFWMGVAIPIGVIAVLASFPYLFSRSSQNQNGSWFPKSGRPVQIIAAGMVLAWLVLTFLEIVK